MRLLNCSLKRASFKPDFIKGATLGIPLVNIGGRAMNMDRNVLIIVFLAAVVLVTGCATMQAYEGPKLRPDQVALIKSETLGTIMGAASVGEIDGKDVGSMQNKVEVLPGNHTVKVMVMETLPSPRYFGNVTLDFNAKAGHIYKVHGRIKNGVWAWITDEKTKEIVAGAKP
jgi:hypothetical protein